MKTNFLTTSSLQPMQWALKNLIWIVTLTAFLTSCNSNDDDGFQAIEIPGITFDGDIDCCTAEEALQVYNFLQTVTIIPELTAEVAGKYYVSVYTKSGKFHTGYNDIYFVATKKQNGNYVKDFQVTTLAPLMTMNMGGMPMRHSTPTSAGTRIFDYSYLALRSGWVSFLMNSTEKDTWELSYDIQVLGETASVVGVPITVDALPEGQAWIKSFKIGDKSFVISLVNPQFWQTGENEIVAYLSERSNPMTEPFPLSTDKFTIDIDPRMPDMGNHTSPNNKSLERQADGSYKGVINLTMTGLWRIHLTVKDAEGNTVYGGGEFDEDGFSPLFWDVTI